MNVIQHSKGETMIKKNSAYVLAFVLSTILSTASFGSTLLTPEHPDPAATPGELCSRNDSDYYENRYKENIPYCERNVSEGLKTRIYEFYGVPKENRDNYTIDHFIPLSIGGSNHQVNLWPEHRGIKALRQNLEMEVYEAVLAGKMTQQEAVSKIVEAKMHPPIGHESEFIQYREVQQ
jgi:hypothetical protein